MNLKSLHRIIHSLTNEEKGLVRKSLSNKRGKKSKYLILFDSLAQVEECTEPFEENIRSRHFPRYDQVYRAKEIVLGKIVASLAEKNEPTSTQLGFIKTAFHLEAFELGEKILIAEMESAQNSGKSYYLMELHNFIIELRDLYQIKVAIPSSVLGFEEILKGQMSSIETDKILREIRSSISMSALDRKRISKSIFSKIGTLQASWHPSPMKLKRLKVRNLILGMDYDLARESQKRFVEELIQKSDRFPLVLKEVELLMRLSLNTNEVQLAQYAFLTLCHLNPISLLDWRLKKRSEIRNGILFASYSVDDEKTYLSWKKLLEFQSIFQSTKLINLLYSSAYIFFSQGSYHRATLALEELDKFKRPDLAHLNWQIGLLRAMLNYEMRKTDLLDFDIRGAERLAKISGLKLPYLAVSAIKTFYAKGHEDNTLLESFLSKYYELVNSADEERASYYFNLEAWLLSKKKKSSMAYIEIEMQRHERQRIIDQLA